MAKTIVLPIKLEGADKVDDSIEKLELKLQELKEEIRGVSEGSMAFEQLSGAINETEEELKNFTQTIGDAAEEQMSLNQQIGEGEDKLMLMAQAGDTSSEAYKKLLAEVGNMKRIQGETNIQIDNAAKGMTGKLVIGLQRVAAAYQVGMAATQIFGVESEKANEIMARLQVVMAFTQGIEQLKQLTVGMNLFGTQGKLALSGIQKGIIATGIGALVVAVGLLVAYWDDIMELTLGISSELNAQLDTQKKSVVAKEDELKAITASENKLKLQGKTEREILELKMASTKAVIEEQKLVVEFQKQKADLEIKAYERNQQIANDIIRGVLELNAMVLRALVAPLDLLIMAANEVSELLGFGELTTFRINDAITEMIDKSSEWAATMLFDPEKKRAEVAEELKIEEDKLLELENQYAGFQLQIQQLDKESADKARELARGNREAVLEILNSRFQKEKELEEARRAESLTSLTGLEAEIARIREESLKAQSQLLEESVADEIKIAEKRFIEGKINEKEFREERAEIILLAETKLNEEERALFELNNKIRERREAEIRKKYTDDANAFFNDIILTADQKEQAQLDKSYAEKKTKLDQFLKDGVLTQEQYNLAIEKMNDDRRKREADKEKKAKDEVVKKTLDTAKNLGDILTNFANTLGSGFGQIFSNLSKGIQDFMTLTKDGIKNDLKGVSELASSIVSATTGAISGLFSILSEERNRNLEEDLGRATETYNDELKVLENMLKSGQITEEEYNKRKFAADMKKFNEEEKLRKAAFESDKGMRIGQAIMAGAQGAVAAFAGAMSLGPILGPVVGSALAGVVAALTGIQVGIISGQQYRGGAAPSAPTAAGMGIGGMTLPAPQPGGSTLFGAAFEGSEGGSTQNPGSQQQEMVVRAYLLEADVKNTQNIISTLEQRSLID